MQVSAGMSSMVVTVSPGLTLHDAACAMADRKVGAAVVLDPEGAGPGIITERDILDAVGCGQDVDTETAATHLTSNLVFASQDWSLEQAAAEMVRRSFRHLVVVEGGELVGVLSMRDIVRCWTQVGATSSMSPP